MRIGLPFKGSGVDVTGLTATSPRVRKGKTFYGAGTDNEQSGTMQDVESINKKMDVNETYNITPGYHDGNDTFFQNLETYRGGFVDPGPGKQVIETKGKYVMYDIIVLEVSGLRPEVIKYGVTVGEGEWAVTGTWQGFVS